MQTSAQLGSGAQPGQFERLLGKAERVFRDELRHACTDRLVQGGLSGFVRFWLSELRASRSARR